MQSSKPFIHTPRLTWNYRVIKHPNGNFAVHEVYYTDTGEVKLYTSEPCVIIADDINSLKSMLDKALKEPVLDGKLLPGYVEK